MVAMVAGRWQAGGGGRGSDGGGCVGGGTRQGAVAVAVAVWYVVLDRGQGQMAALRPESEEQPNPRALLEGGRSSFEERQAAS